MMIVTEQELAAAELEAQEWGGIYRPVFLAHVTALDAIMDDRVMMGAALLEDACWGAVRAWIDRATIFVADPAVTIQEARAKVLLIRHVWATDLSLLLNKDGEVNAIGMLLAAAETESQKWGLGPVNDNGSEAQSAAYETGVTLTDGPSLPDRQIDTSIPVPTSKIEAYVRLHKEVRTVRAARRAFNETLLSARWTRRSNVEHGVSLDCDDLCMALLRLLAAKAESEQELEAKQRTLVEHISLIASYWLVNSMVGVALQMDYDRAKLSPASRSRLRAMLPEKAQA